jgi:3-deoxy-D-manno-octulosonic-acid transferase
MVGYSLLLSLAVVVMAPWWLYRVTAADRDWLRQRVSGVPGAVKDAVRGQRVIWVHAVSVGEVLGASRLIAELETALGVGWVVVISTTTKTGQALAKERFGTGRVFYMPLDFAFAVRPVMQALKPEALVLIESELWPRILHEFRKAGAPVVVVNARVSDRSFGRAMRVRALWAWVLRMPSLWLAQSEEDARRLVAMGASADAVRVGGNLKYDVRAPKVSAVAERIKEAAAGRPIVVAGSTVAALNEKSFAEEELVIKAWEGRVREEFGALLVIAPRHPERFAEVEAAVGEFAYVKASNWGEAKEGLDVVVLDTIGDLAAVYGVADVAFVGGSLIKRGGHNPLEPAQFGVPVVVGPSFENFRDMVTKMQEAGGICIVKGVDQLEEVLVGMLRDPAAARAMGERGRQVFEAQQGATARAVEAIVGMIQGAKA